MSDATVTLTQRDITRLVRDATTLAATVKLYVLPSSKAERRAIHTATRVLKKFTVNR